MKAALVLQLLMDPRCFNSACMLRLWRLTATTGKQWYFLIDDEEKERVQFEKVETDEDNSKY